MCGCKGKCGCNITSTTKGEKGDASQVSSLGYKVYVALLSQNGTSAPTAIVLQNTLGADIVWTYDAVGDYTGTLSGVFTNDKTITIPLIEKYTINDLAGDANIRIAPNDINTVKIKTLDNGFVDVNGILLNSPIEIRVYL